MIDCPVFAVVLCSDRPAAVVDPALTFDTVWNDSSSTPLL